MDNSLDVAPKKYISWKTLALMDFVTVIGFDDLIYNFKNQGLGVVTSWILMLFLYVIPYSLMVGQLGSVFNKEGGGLSSWVRGTSGNFMGYMTAWTYWAASIPYVVDTANSIVVGVGWAVNGNESMQDTLGNQRFALLTFVVFVAFIFLQAAFKRALEWLSIAGGVAMFGLTILFVIMTFSSLALPGGHVATQPMNIQAFIPKFDLRYLATIGMLIYAVNGAELVAPFVTQMKNPKREFPKAMIMLAAMTAFLTIFGSIALGIFFNAHNLPYDLKMNGSYYAFQALGEQYHMGNFFMYCFAITEVIYLAALLAVLLDAMTRMLISDTGKKYMPKGLLKLNKNGLPINGYFLTCGLSALILFLSVFLKDMNAIFNQLLDLNGIISPYVTCWIFFAFMKIRRDSKKYPSEYVFIKNDKLAYTVGLWCFVVTFIAATVGVVPKDAGSNNAFWHQLILNIVEVIILFGLGIIMPLIARFERRKDGINLE